MGGDAGELGAKDTGSNHAVCVAERSDSGFEEDIMVVEVGGSGDLVDFVRFVELWLEKMSVRTSCVELVCIVDHTSTTCAASMVLGTPSNPMLI